MAVEIFIIPTPKIVSIQKLTKRGQPLFPKKSPCFQTTLIITLSVG